ncbi:MAG: hypothetical protein ACRERW_14795 [Pseudomonas sp.]
MPAKNDNAVSPTHRSAWFAGKPGSYKKGSSRSPRKHRNKVRPFFKALGPEGCAQIEAVAMELKTLMKAQYLP